MFHRWSLGGGVQLETWPPAGMEANDAARSAKVSKATLAALGLRIGPLES
jgi:hypothetical protein